MKIAVTGEFARYLPGPEICHSPVIHLEHFASTRPSVAT